MRSPRRTGGGCRGWRAILPAALIVQGCAPGSPPLPEASADPYRLGTGDTIRLIVYGEEHLSGQYRVSDAGTIALPLLGPTRAAGLTTDGLQGEIADALTQRKLMRDPSVSAEIVSYRPVFVLGEVAKPGQYAYQPGMSVLTAVALAGGFTYSARKGSVVVQRSEDGRTVEGSAAPTARVQPGDIITVAERYF